MAKSLATLLLVLALAALPAAAQKKKSPGKSSGDGEFQALIDRYYQLWSTLNADDPAPLYAKDADLVFYDAAPLKYTGWEEYKAGVKKTFFDQMESGAISHKDDLKVTRRGNIAWTTVTGHLTGKMRDGKTVEAGTRRSGRSAAASG